MGKLVNKELIDLNEQISSTTFQTVKATKNLQRVKGEKEDILKRIKNEKLIFCDGQSGDLEFWSGHIEKLKSEVIKIKNANMAVSASSDVTHRALQSQIEGASKKVASIKEKRASLRERNVEFELSVIALNET